MFNDFSVGDIFHIEIVNGNGEILHRLYSTLFQVHRTELVIDLPTCKDTYEQISLQDNTILVISFQSLTRIAHRFKTIVTRTSNYGRFIKLHIKRPKKRDIFSFDDRKLIRISTHYGARIIPISFSQNQLDSFDVSFLENPFKVDGIITDISNNGTFGLSLSKEFVKSLTINDSLLFYSESNLAILKRSKGMDERSATVGDIIDITPYSEQFVKVVVKLNLTREQLDFLCELIFEIIEQEFVDSLITNK